MKRTLATLIGAYNDALPLEEAWSIPKAWYTDERIFELEQARVFGRAFQPVAREVDLAEAGRFVTAEVGGEPVVVVRGRDGSLRSFFNVCRHKAAAVVIEPEGRAQSLRCPYHGWTYSLEGELKRTPELEGVCNFDKSKSGLLPAHLEVWEGLVFVALDEGAVSVRDSVRELGSVIEGAGPSDLRFHERRVYNVDCNWKVYVDNYLDGGYHVPHVHRGLHSVLDYAAYTVEGAGALVPPGDPDGFVG